MKHLIISVCTGVALASAALTQAKQQSQQNDNDNTTTTVHRSSGTGQTAPVSTRPVTRTLPVTTQRQVSTAPFRQRTYTVAPHHNGNATGYSNSTTNARLRERSFRQSGRVGVQSNVAVNRDRNIRSRNFSGNTATNVAVNRNRNVRVTNNWRSSQFSGRQYAAFRDYHRQSHDRDWWRHHYNRVSFVSGGWWYWDAGYWYPAWGYDPYAYYPYDGPIYGYSDLTPDRVVSEVQAQLQRDGYYDGPIDGVLGPMTRQAIAAFQADHGLAITSAVDEPTLATLGLS